MRIFPAFLGAVLGLTASSAQAAKILILTDPMTLQRRVVVIDGPGPDRLFLCATPPAVAGCREVTGQQR